jgi:hypothetical protein
MALIGPLTIPNSPTYSQSGNQPIADAVHGLHIQLLLGLGRHEAHVLLRNRLGDGFGINEVLVGLSIGLYKTAPGSVAPGVPARAARMPNHALPHMPPDRLKKMVSRRCMPAVGHVKTKLRTV